MNLSPARSRFARLPAASRDGHCCLCPRPSEHRIARREYCAAHASAILDAIRERVIVAESLSGVGVQSGRLRPDHGPGCAELTCSSCGAGWVGRLLAPCPWCELAGERLIAHQARMLLHPTLPDRGDSRRRAALEAWAERLVRGVSAELITRAEAIGAWRREAA